MGEYLKIGQSEVKIGTCEDLYYCTFNQLKKLKTQNTKTFLEKENGFRYRFPFPDEDHKKIGSYEDYDRGYLFKIPKSSMVEICHGTTFFRTDEKQDKLDCTTTPPPLGFRLPCIQDKSFPVEKFDWQNTASLVIFEIVQQKQADNELQTVVRCPYCGEKSRLDANEALAVFEYVIKHGNDFEKELCKRMVDGYNIPKALLTEV